MKCRYQIKHLLIAVLGAAVINNTAADATPKQINIAISSTSEAIKWYEEILDCKAIAGRDDTVDCGKTEIVFIENTTLGGSNGTGVDHIGFSYADLTSKMAELEDVGVRGSGVRLQRFDDGSLIRDIPGLFKIAFIFDPWGTRIEMLEDKDTLGFHHIHLNSTDPAATLTWYEQSFGGQRAKLKDRIDGLLFDNIWLLVSKYNEQGRPAATHDRAIDHISFSMSNLEQAVANMKARGVQIEQAPQVPEQGHSDAKRAFIMGPDRVTVALIEPGWKGENLMQAKIVTAPSKPKEPYVVPRTPWGEPDLQGIWTADAAHGIPLERPANLDTGEVVSAEEAEARRERGTLRSIWGYDREWRDTTLGYVRHETLRQAQMIIDPPNGRLPPTTKDYQARAAKMPPRVVPNRATGPEDLSTYVRCITRGPVGMMMPSIYNNGLQIIQSPGHVAMQKEMIHETRVIPTQPRPPLGDDIEQWLGDSQGYWDGDTLVVEVRNFNGRTDYEGSAENMQLTQRFTRTGPETLEYMFTVEDPTVWTRPWTAVFTFVRDDSQYELVEYACHEGNYGMSNTLSAARALDGKEILGTKLEE
jgi:catechol 2,3-dioxygenase-like lactoylglutathione lyase family enzyme